MPFGFDTSRPDTGHGIRDRVLPGTSWGQRLFNLVARGGASFLGGPALAHAV
jgi:hypothetical protein